MTKNVYLFSGLGADERVFQKLDLPEANITYIKWISPNKYETIEQYAGRIIDQITTPYPILIGLSFGGFIAIEVAKQINTAKVILLASAKTKNEIPFYFRLIGKLDIHKLIPTKLLKSANFITYWFFGASASSDKKLLREILNDTDPNFLQWAIDKAAKWGNENPVKNLVHIHGTNDRILPYRWVRCDYTIKDGGHLMTLNKHEELNSILNELLNSTKNQI